MDSINIHQNRAREAAVRIGGRASHLPTMQAASFSADYNQRVEVCSAPPSYTWVKTRVSVGAMADDADPNAAAPPAAQIWDMTGYMSGSGYLVLDAAETVDLQLWALDAPNNTWFRVATLANVARYTEFAFTNQVRGRVIWLRMVNIGAAIRDITIRFSAE